MDNEARAFGSTMRVTDPVSAAILADPQRWQFIGPFLARENTLSGAARELEQPLHTVKYRVNQLLEAGLLRVTREQARAGRAVKYYRSSADAFFVPYAAMPVESIEQHIYESDEPWQRAFTRAVARTRGFDMELRGRILANGPEGCPRLSAASWAAGASAPTPDWARNLEPDAPAVFSTWARAELTLEEAKELQRLLVEIVHRGPGERQGPRWPYLLHLGLAPLPPDD